MLKKTQWLLLVLSVACLGLTGGLIGGVSAPLVAEMGSAAAPVEAPGVLDGAVWGALAGVLLGIWLVRLGWRFLKAALYFLSVAALAVCALTFWAVRYLGVSW